MGKKPSDKDWERFGEIAGQPLCELSQDDQRVKIGVALIRARDRAKTVRNDAYMHPLPNDVDAFLAEATALTSELPDHLPQKAELFARIEDAQHLRSQGSHGEEGVRVLIHLIRKNWDNAQHDLAIEGYEKTYSGAGKRRAQEQREKWPEWNRTAHEILDQRSRRPSQRELAKLVRDKVDCEETAEAIRKRFQESVKERCK